MVDPAGNPSSFETPCEAAWLLRMRGCVFLMLTIFLYLPSCVHSSPKRGRFRSGLWRGGEAAPAGVEYLSALPGGLLKAAGARAIPHARGGELARPGLRRGRVRERLKARRRRALPYGPDEGDGERRSGGEILSALRDAGLSSAPATGATLRAGAGRKDCAPGQGHSIRRDGETQPGDRRGNLPPWDRWGNSLDAGRTLRAGEQDGSAQNRRARSAGSSPIAY